MKENVRNVIQVIFLLWKVQMTIDETKALVLVKTAIEFNARIMAIATQVFSAKAVKTRTVQRELERAFDDYAKQVSKIMEAE